MFFSIQKNLLFQWRCLGSLHNVHKREWDPKHPADKGQQSAKEEGDSTNPPLWGKTDP